jgi:hypothetical protein
MLKIACIAGLCLLCATASHARPPTGGSLLQPMHSDSKDCLALKHPEGWSVSVSYPGDYCIEQNLYQAWPLFRLPHQPVPLDPLISVNSSNVTVDLMGRNLSAKTPIGKGVWVNTISATPKHSIKIWNGSISTSRELTIFMVHGWNGKNNRFGDTYSIASSYGDLGQYHPTEFVLENLTLEAENHVIIMQGKKNVIRNCKIIGGNGTVNLYGPNLVFENNEIILHAKDPKNGGDEPPVALYLEDAADSVVRNNRILINGQASKADAIVLKNSPNVLIEGNTIKGAKDVYKRLDERSSVKATANSLK